MTIETMLDSYEQKHVINVIDQAGIHSSIKNLKKGLSGNVGSIKSGTLNAYREARRQLGIQDSSINKELRILRAAARFSGESLPDMPLVREQPRISAIDAGSINLLIESADDDRTKEYIRLLFITAQRKDAVLRLRRDQIVDGVIEFNAAGGYLAHRRKGRGRIPITPEIQSILDRLIAKYGHTKYILPDDSGFGYCKKLERWFKEAAIKAGISITPHGIRHSAATLAIASGIPIYTVSSMLGHANTRITEQVYLEKKPEHNIAGVSMLGGMLA